jgi:DNA-binding FadR family transcriptional regulator
MPKRGIERLRDGILEMIADRGLSAGDRVPTEAEISQEFQVSRPMVREALHELESLGVLRSRQGSGRVLLDRSHYSIAALLGGTVSQSPADLMDAIEVRQVLELGFLAAALRKLDDVAIADMRDAIVGMRVRAEAGEPFPAEDRAFHDALFRGVGNDLLTKLRANFWMLFAGVDLEHLHHRERPAETIRHHENILTAVERGDYAIARFHLETHFYDSYESLRDFVQGSAAILDGGP